MRAIIGAGGILFRRGTGLFKILFTIDDAIRMVAITLVFWLIALIFGISGIWFWLLIGLGFLIDVHDIADDLREGKPLW